MTKVNFYSKIFFIVLKIKNFFMKEIMLQIIRVAYASVGVIGLMAYWPTIKDLYYKKPSANTTSYVLWTTTAVISVLYSVFILSDLLFRLVAGMNFFACASVLFLRIRLRNKKSSL